jgi:murein DD-endopeptidase MepM/ murein hydrolase activator NlpD
MTRPRVVALTVAGAASLVLLCCGGVSVASVSEWLAGQRESQPVAAGSCGAVVTATVRPAAVKVSGWSAEQITNATTIVHVGQQLQVPPRGWVIAVATAMQESTLHNLGDLGSRNDHDSLGLFQQRPSQGWGSPAQVMDPVYASKKFYERLLQVPGWQTMSLTQAAQRVQRSAFPDAYAKHEVKAAALVGSITGGVDQAASQPGQCAAPGEVTAGGWVRPVAGKVGSGFGPRGRRLHAGVDLMVPRRTQIRAAAAGTVIKAICDPSTAKAWGCDRDGQVVNGEGKTPGCGWYVDIAHADGIMTRYCHMIVRPLVVAGQKVAAGEQIGWSGSSGHSSGPHLHFEVHLHGDRTPQGAVNPVQFMKEHGAPLGSGDAR